MKLFNTRVIEKQYLCIPEIIKEIDEKLFENKRIGDYYCIDIIVNCELTSRIICYIQSTLFFRQNSMFYNKEIEYKQMSFADSDKSYTITFGTDGQIWCQPSYQNEYIEFTCNEIYISEKISNSIYNHIDADKIIRFKLE